LITKLSIQPYLVNYEYWKPKKTKSNLQSKHTLLIIVTPDRAVEPY